MNMLGFDIGGANLKAAHTDGLCQSVPFEFWKRKADFAAELLQLMQGIPKPAGIAVTMTAEIADCFTSKAEGVRYIIEQVVQVAADIPVSVWTTSGEFVPPHIAIHYPKLVAAANWHALATWLGRLVPDRNALLIDIGSTTTDLIPLQDGRPVPHGLTDVDRLCSGELVYTGVWRTPLCAIANRVPFNDTHCMVAAELFATTLDVYLLLNKIPEDATCLQTADGRAATKAAACHRLSHLLCCDSEEVSAQQALDIASFYQEQQLNQLLYSLEKVLEQAQPACTHVLISGSGSFLVSELLARHPQLSAAERLDINEMFNPATAEAACAYAVAQLAAERGL